MAVFLRSQRSEVPLEWLGEHWEVAELLREPRWGQAAAYGPRMLGLALSAPGVIARLAGSHSSSDVEKELLVTLPRFQSLPSPPLLAVLIKFNIKVKH